jgi:quercetin dioxygenase-like cupin family protein
MSSILVVPPGALRPAPMPTPGVVREVAFDLERAVMVRARAEARAESGWHHHGDRDVFGYLLRGRALFEFGPGGRGRAEVEEGGFFHVPRGLVHRDVNPTDEPQEFALTFVGSGPLVVNLEGAPPDEPRAERRGPDRPLVGHLEGCTIRAYSRRLCETCGWMGCPCLCEHTGYGEMYCPKCDDEL